MDKAQVCLFLAAHREHAIPYRSHVSTLFVLSNFKEKILLWELPVAPSSIFGRKCSRFTFLVKIFRFSWERFKVGQIFYLNWFLSQFFSSAFMQGFHLFLLINLAKIILGP
jgi:hypothetical protein